VGALTRWRDYAPLQYLGKISYSLYLSHLLVAIYVLRLGYRLTGTNHAGAVFWFFFAGLASIGAAHVIYLLVERPSVRFAARFKPSGRGGRTSSIGGEPAGGNWVASGPGRKSTDDLRAIPIDR
jgi:peptidoglycan/LPS O-acetylase OafA/YrhL